MNKLYIVGDSFSADSSPNTWPWECAQKLNLELKNLSMIGSSQDYAWHHLEQIIPKMTAGDRLIVVLTHPGRVWYFQDRPYISNINLIDLDDHVDKEAANAIKLYVQHIQRDEIDSIHLNHRLAWLCWHTSLKKLAKPLCLVAMPQMVTDLANVQNLSISKGALSNVQNDELVTSENMDDLWRGVDSRYNHLCIRNHKVLTEKIISFFNFGLVVDLEQGFYKHFLDVHSLSDPDFIKAELCAASLIRCMEKRLPGAVRISWKEKLGIHLGLGG